MTFLGYLICAVHTLVDVREITWRSLKFRSVDVYKKYSRQCDTLEEGSRLCGFLRNNKFGEIGKCSLKELCLICDFENE